MAVEHKFPEGAEEYYDVAKAREVLARELPEGLYRWRCKLCGWPIAVTEKQLKFIGACCCGGCGMTCLRPIEEY